MEKTMEETETSCLAYGTGAETECQRQSKCRTAQQHHPEKGGEEGHSKRPFEHPKRREPEDSEHDAILHGKCVYLSNDIIVLHALYGCCFDE